VGPDGAGRGGLAGGVVVNAPFRAFNFRDTLVNLFSGLGGPKDKSALARYTWVPLQKDELEFAYRGDWVARKAVDIPAQDATREWRRWQARDDQVEKIEAAEKALQLQYKVKRALIRARLYGGAAIIIGVDGNQEEELVPDKVGVGDLKFLHVVSRWELSYGQLQLDMTKPYFGEPLYYERNVPGQLPVRMHPSRVVRFIGAEGPDPLAEADAWGDSILQSIYEAVRSAGLVQSSIAGLIDELKVDVYRIPGLSERIVTQEYRDALTTRFSYANLMKSTNHALIMDKEEEWQRVQLNLTGMPDLQKQYLLLASGAADIPATRFLSQSPSGLNATGDSDIRNYYDNIADDQATEVGPRLERIDEVLIRSALGSRDPAIYYKWAPLWQMDEEQQAKIAHLKAQAFQLHSASGLIPDAVLSEGLVNQLVEDGVYPGLDQAMQDFNYEKLFGPADEPPQTPPAPALPPVGGVPQLPPPRDSVLAGWRRALRDAEPRPLYVWRQVLNSQDIIAWARAQGFRSTLPAGGLHVTILYSKQAVDWMAMGTDGWGDGDDGTVTVPAGGPRLVEQFGPSGAIVLEFTSSRLSWRHMSMRDRGASSDFEEYRPHMTISYSGEGLNLDEVEPYRGHIRLGPEVFEEIRGAGFDLSQVEEVATDSVPAPHPQPTQLADALRAALEGVPQPVINVHVDSGPGRVVRTVEHDEHGRAARIIEERG
jgi:uncharacterized protein